MFIMLCFHCYREFYLYITTPLGICSEATFVNQSGGRFNPCFVGAKVTNVHPGATLDKKVPFLLLVSALCCFLRQIYPQNALFVAKNGEKCRNYQFWEL